MRRFPLKTTQVIALSLLSWLLTLQSVSAQGPRLLKPGTLPADKRIAPLKDLDGYFPFQNPDTKQAWQRRRVQLQQRLLVSQGIWPMPSKTPLKTVIHSRRRLHTGKGLLREPARFLRDRQPLSPTQQDRSATSRSLPPRALEQRQIPRRGSQ